MTLPAKLPMATKARSFGVNEVNRGSPSRILMVLRISFGMTTLPRSSMRRTIPVAFILKCLLCFLSCARLVFAGLHFPMRTGNAGRCWRQFSSKIKLDLVFTRSSFDKASRIVARSRRYHACASPGSLSCCAIKSNFSSISRTAERSKRSEMIGCGGFSRRGDCLPHDVSI